MENDKEHNNGPYTAIVSIKAEVMDVLQNGNVSGIPRHTEKKIVSVIANTYDECIDKLNTLMKGIKNA